MILRKIASLGDFYRIMLHEKRWPDKVTRYPPILSHLGLSLLPATGTISAIYFITMDYGRNNILFILYVQIMIDPKFICVCIRFEIIQLYIVNNKCILIKIYTFLERALFICSINKNALSNDWF